MQSNLFKKLVSLTLAVCLFLGSCPVSALAEALNTKVSASPMADDIEKQNPQTPVDSYLASAPRMNAVSISDDISNGTVTPSSSPPTLDIPFGAESTDLAVEVTVLHLPANSNALKVAVSQMNPLANADGKQISYTIDGKAAGAARYFQTLEKQCFAIGITADAWNKAPAGSYSGTVSFSVSFDNLATK